MFIENGKTLSFKRDFKVPVERLFEAWAKPELVKAWWKDLDVVEMDVRVGGRYRLTWKNSPGEYSKGEYTEIVPNRKIAFTWDTSAACQGEPEREIKGSRIILTFESAGPASSRMELWHEGLPTDADRQSHNLGWMCALWDADNFFNAPARDLSRTPEIRLTRKMPASVERVWDAWTKPELMLRWFNSAEVTNPELQASNPLELKKNMRLDYLAEDGTIYPHLCELKEIVPGKKLRFMWLSDFSQYESEVEVVLRPLGANETELTLVHRLLETEEMRAMHLEGWNDCLDGMTKLLSA